MASRQYSKACRISRSSREVSTRLDGVARAIEFGRRARRRDSECGPAGGVGLHLVRPIVAIGAVEHVGGAFVAIHAHAVAIASAQQRGHGLVEQLSGEVPERHLDGADGAHQHVGRAIDAVSQSIVKCFDFQRILAEEIGAQLQYARLHADAGAAIALADSVYTGVADDFHKGVSAGALQDHHADVGNARTAAFGGGQRAEGAERCGRRKGAQKSAARKRKHRMPAFYQTPSG